MESRPSRANELLNPTAEVVDVVDVVKFDEDEYLSGRGLVKAWVRFKRNACYSKMHAATASRSETR